MKNKIVIKTLASITAVASCIGLTGCGNASFTSRNVASYPLVNALTQQELMDYYAESMKYDSIVSRNVTVHETTYETKDIDGEKAEKLKSLVSQAEAILATNDYEYSLENSVIMDEDTYNYIKANIDNIYVTNGSITNIKGALGYYFVDVNYTINPKSSGTFNQMTPLIGLDGVFCTSPSSEYTIDIGYMITIAKKLNEYYTANKIMQAATFDIETGEFMIVDGADPSTMLTTSAITGKSIGESLGTSSMNTPSTTNNTSNNDDIKFDELGNVVDDDGNIIYTPEEYQQKLDEEAASQVVIDQINNGGQNGGMSYESIVSTDRMITLDSELINSLAGISLKQKAFLPDLNLVYNKPNEQGTFGGYGIYTEGGNGLKVFGFDRNNLTGNITIRYVFKDASDGTDNIIGVNAYITDEEVTTGFNVADQNLVIPEFLNQQFEMLIERSDRVMADCDLTGLMSANIYQDMGVAVLRGYRELNTNTLKYLSTIRQVIARDYDTNSYLVEVETTIQEGAKSVDSYGNYRDKYYMVIQQQGTDFLIVDSIRMSREMTKEPSINPDDATTKRLVALNLAGEVTDDAKTAVNKLLSDWYTASTNRLLYARDEEGNLKTFTVDGNEITLERGMYDCFQSDVTMLSSENLEYMQSQVRTQLDKYGSNITSIYCGTVTQWLGGADNQVEFTTEELITYAGRDDAHYMQVYYLASNMNDVWVIDERTILDERDVSGADLSNIQSRIN